ncbi:MAG: thiolase C-terminal domain-containing protein [Candidatus Binatia bacterium]
MSLSGKVAIAGVGETRYAKRSDRPLMAMMLEAAKAALADAGLEASDVDGLVLPDADYAGLHEFARSAGITRQFFAAESFGGGTAVVSSLLLGAMAIETGVATTILCCQGVDWGSERRGNVGQPHAEMRMKANLEIPFGWYPQVVHFAGMARRRMELYGMTEAQLGTVAVAFRRHARLSGNAVMTDPLTLEGYLAEPYLAEPFRILDCCLVTDGAAAFVITSTERAKDLRRRPVIVLGVGQGVSPDGEFSTLRRDYLKTAAVHAAPRAYSMAGVRPADVDFVELYDNFTAMVLQQLEDLGFCAEGEGGSFVEGGRIEIGGALPVNTAGGMLSQAFVLSANFVVEAARQLRGQCGERQVEDATIGMVTGYTGAQYAAALLARE